jgi:hypothetical protein
MSSNERKKHIYRIFNLYNNIWKSTLQYKQGIIKTIKSLRIYNWFSFIAALLGFIGTFIIVMDKFGPIHRKISQLNKWKNISIALENLNTFDTNKDNLGMIESGEEGFMELVDIIYGNRPDLADKKIEAIAKNKPITVGGIPFGIIHLVFLNNINKGYPLTTEYIFHEWINNYREKHFLKKGLWLIALGFLLGIFGHIKRKPLIKENV